MHKVAALAALSCAVTLSACGSGGGGGGIASLPPPPPPSPAYATFAPPPTDQDFSFAASIGSTLGNAGTGTNPIGTVQQYGEGSFKISYNAASQSYTLEDGITSQTFRPADLDLALDPKGNTYVKGRSTARADSLIFLKSSPSSVPITLTYSSMLDWSSLTNNISYRQVYGVAGIETVSTDMPKTGRGAYGGFTYATNLATRQTFQGGSSMIVDFSTGTLTTSFFLNGALPMGTLNVNGTGTIAANSNRFAGNLSGNIFSGDFAGAFYGPRAAEMGYVFKLTGTDGTLLTGASSGKYQGVPVN